MGEAREQEIAGELDRKIDLAARGEQHLDDDHWLGHFDRGRGKLLSAIDQRVGLVRSRLVDANGHAVGKYMTGEMARSDARQQGIVDGSLSRLSAAQALASGANGFFAARPIGPWMQPDGTIEATSFYDTGELKRTLERLVDFERINAGVTRLSVGAVNVRTGNFVYFDNTAHSIRPEHVMASAALPPSFPAVEIEGEYYWDGGVVSNTPLQLVVDDQPRGDTLAFQVDR